MRKTILFIMVSLMALSLVACGDDEKKVTEKETTAEKVTTEGTEENNTTEDDKNNETEETTEKDIEMLDIYTGSVNFKLIKGKYPSDYYADDQGCTEFIYKDKKFIYGIRADVGSTQEPFSGKLEDVVSYTVNSSAISELTYGINMSFDEKKGFEIVSSEEIKVGEKDCIKYTGKIYSIDGKENFYYCYAMILDNTPVVVFGFVYDESQNDELIKQAMQCTDDLVKTIEVSK